jgi:alkanesulfonate monooxygenase SsuD/methylene tetrahydromethanopterin reductase-like flavin-dependent oxidoreductase (luciferase family)
MPTPIIPCPTFGLNLPMVGADMSAGRLLSELVEEVKGAERAGFDLVLVPEHHRGPPGSLTDPLVVSAWMLANSDRIRVGPGVLILPLASVPRLAEQGAILQHASGGRFVLGVGAGYNESDFSVFGVDRNLRTSALVEGVQSLRDAWEPSENAATVRPAFDTVSPPPLWLGAWSESGVDRAARLADGWIADPLHTSAEVAAMAHEYVRRANGAHRPPYVIAMRELWVDETDAAAREVYGPVVEAVFRYYARSGALKNPAGSSDMKLDGVLDDRVLCGSVATVTDRLCELHATVNAQSYVFSLRHPGGPSSAQVLEAIERLGHDVMPAFQKRVASPVPSARSTAEEGLENGGLS